MILSHIGQKMRAKADLEGTAYRGLTSGLHLHLSTSGGIYTLLLWRTDTLPSQEEIETVMREWKLPLDAEVSAPAQLVWVKDRKLDDSTCRIITWGGPPQVREDEPTGEALNLDRPHLRARPSPHLSRFAGIVGTPVVIPHRQLAPRNDPTMHVWLQAVERELAQAQACLDGAKAVNDPGEIAYWTGRVEHFQSVLDGCLRSPRPQEAA